MKRRSQSENSAQMWMWLVMGVKSNAEQYCVKTWYVGSMNQNILEVVKQEMSRVNINILGISELKWSWNGKFNSDDHYIYYCEQESLRKNGAALTVNKSQKCSTWVQFQKWQNNFCSFPRQTIQYHISKSVPQPLKLKLRKLNGSMKAYKMFHN